MSELPATDDKRTQHIDDGLEERFLGAVMGQPKEVAARCFDLLSGYEAFWFERHRMVAAILHALIDEWDGEKAPSVRCAEILGGSWESLTETYWGEAVPDETEGFMRIGAYVAWARLTDRTSDEPLEIVRWAESLAWLYKLRTEHGQDTESVTESPETTRRIELDELRAAHSSDGAIVDPGPWPTELFELPGIGADWMRYAEETAHRWQPALALGAIVTATGALIGRHVQSSTGAKANLYCLGVAESGAGKERPRQVIKQTMIKSGVDDRVLGPEDLASEAGLIKSVEMHPAQVMLIDELAFLLKAANDPKSGGHLHGIIGSLLRLYSSSNTRFVGKAYADASKNPVINMPHCCLWGTTTPGKLYDSLTEESVDNGLLGRCLLFEVDNHRPDKRIVQPMEAPEHLCDVVRSWMGQQPAGMSEGQGARTVPLTSEAMKLFAAYDVEAEEWDRALDGHPCRPLAVRLAENAAKLALVHAWWVDPSLPEIGRESVSWGCQVADYCTRRMAWAVSRHVSSNELEKMRKQVLTMIHDSQMAGLTNREIIHRTRGINKVTREHIIGDLVEEGAIALGDGVSPKGRKVRVYRGIDFVV